ncbi:hypothetical protein H6P81_021240 [Aristolochia fimbriata]|uniref:Uncharacterized protein n=1 Tax=Aristolochia fimbriata TaxID=158543 RepID=A0AAV7DS03_ARIFI|nr:hypothetical protein H6P81_021240 [Aristolochia fimbriata]
MVREVFDRGRRWRFADNAMEKSTEPYHLEEGEVRTRFPRGEPRGRIIVDSTKRSATCLTKLHTMPRWATGAAGCVNARQSSRCFATGRRRVSAPRRPRRSGTRTHTNNHSGATVLFKEEGRRIPRTIEVFERKLHPRPLGQGYTCRAPRPTQFSPPTPRSPAAPPLAGGRVAGAQQIGRPCPPGAGWLKTLCPKGTSHDEWWWPAPGPKRGLKSRSEALAQEDPAGQLPPRDRRPCSDWHPSSQKPPLRDGPGASPMEWGPERVTAPLCPDPAATARRCRRSRVVWECSPNRAGSGWGRAARSVRAGRREPVRRRLGRRPTLVTGDQARRMIPPKDTPPLADRGGWRYDSPDAPSRAPARRLAPGQLAPHSTRLETRTKESDMCAKPAGAPNPIAGARAAKFYRVGRAAASLSRARNRRAPSGPFLPGLDEEGGRAVAAKPRARSPGGAPPVQILVVVANIQMRTLKVKRGKVPCERTCTWGSPETPGGASEELSFLFNSLPTLETAQPEVGSSGWKSTDDAAGVPAARAPLKTGGPKVPPTPGRIITASGLQGKGSRQNGSQNSGKGLALEGWARGPSPQPAGGCRWTARSVPRRARAGRARRAGDGSGTPLWGLPRRRTADSELVPTRGN